MYMYDSQYFVMLSITILATSWENQFYLNSLRIRIKSHKAQQL